MEKLPQFNAKDLCRALKKLGFEECPHGAHQHKYKHPTRISAGRRPYFVFPDNIGKKREFQKALLRDIERLWDFSVEEIVGALK